MKIARTATTNVIAACLISAALLSPARAMDVLGDLRGMLRDGKNFIFAINPKNGTVAFMPFSQAHATAAQATGARGGNKDVVRGFVKFSPDGTVRFEAYPGAVKETFPGFNMDKWLGELAQHPDAQPLFAPDVIGDVHIDIDSESQRPATQSGSCGRVIQVCSSPPAVGRHRRHAPAGWHPAGRHPAAGRDPTSGWRRAGWRPTARWYAAAR